MNSDFYNSVGLSVAKDSRYRRPDICLVYQHLNSVVSSCQEVDNYLWRHFQDLTSYVFVVRKGGL